MSELLHFLASTAFHWIANGLVIAFAYIVSPVFAFIDRLICRGWRLIVLRVAPKHLS